MKKFCFIFCLCLAFLLGACSIDTVYAESESGGFYIKSLGSSGMYRIFSMEDNETGIHYLLIWERVHGNIAITQRLNVDGTPYIGK